jgi:hypothetical protein
MGLKWEWPDEWSVIKSVIDDGYEIDELRRDISLFESDAPVVRDKFDASRNRAIEVNRRREIAYAEACQNARDFRAAISKIAFPKEYLDLREWLEECADTTPSTHWTKKLIEVPKDFDRWKEASLATLRSRLGEYQNFCQQIEKADRWIRGLKEFFPPFVPTPHNIRRMF